jgi:hypothetical protein
MPWIVKCEHCVWKGVAPSRAGAEDIAEQHKASHAGEREPIPSVTIVWRSEREFRNIAKSDPE